MSERRVLRLNSWVWSGWMAVAMSGAAGCQRAPLCMPYEMLDPRVSGCVPICGTPEAPISRDCFDRDSGMIREGGVALDASDASDASDITAVTDVRDASEGDGDAMAGDADPCGAGREMVAGECDIRLPRAIAPLSTSRVTSRSPRLKWALPAGVTSAHVEVCADRLCARLLAEGDAATEWMPPSELPSGVVFWRLRGVVGAARSVRTSPTWWTWVPARSATGGVQSSWGSVPDVNGDGLGDVVVGSPEDDDSPCRGTCLRGTVDLHLSTGVVGGLGAPTQTLESSELGAGFGFSVSSAGDINGDGSADLLVGEPYWQGMAFERRGRTHVFLAASGALPLRPHRVIEPLGDVALAGLSVDHVGDVNGDGFADAVVGIPLASAGGRTLSGEVRIYFGGSDGIPTTPTQRLSGAAQDSLGYPVRGIGDINGDGFADVAVGAFGGLNAMPPTAGRVEIFLGSPSGLQTTAHRVIPSMTVEGVFNRNTRTRGDLNGDGFADLVLVWRNFGSPSPGDRIMIYRGSSAGLAMTPSQTIGSNGDQFDSVSLIDSNQDGLDDLIVSRTPSMQARRMELWLSSATAINTTPTSSVVEAGMRSLSGYDIAVLGPRTSSGAFEVVIGATTGGFNDQVLLYSLGRTGFGAMPSDSRSDDREGYVLGVSVAGW
jgi:hypothetical protein